MSELWFPKDPSVIPWPVNPLTCAESKLPRGPNGRKLCRCGCGREATPPKRCFYSDECIEAYSIFHNWNILRHRVILRDKGICQICGVDIKEFKRDVHQLHWEFGLWSERTKQLEKCLKHEGWNLHNGGIEVDHIIPRVEGGSNHPDNLRVLCEPCHKEETRKLRRRRKKS